MALNVSVLLNESAAQHPQRPALIHNGSQRSYAGMNAAANKVANALISLGVRRGETVAIMAPNITEFPIIYFGALKMGAVVCPLNPALAPDLLRNQMQHVSAVALFVWEPLAEQTGAATSGNDVCRHVIVIHTPGSHNLPDRAISLNAMLAIGSSAFDTVWTMADDVAVIQFTAGMGGAPKASQLSHTNLLLNAAILADRVLRLQPSDIGLAALPLWSPFGQTCLMNSLLYAGGALALPQQLHARSLLASLQDCGATYMVSTPAMLSALADEGGTAGLSGSLKLCLSAGAPLPATIKDHVTRSLGAAVLNAYGLAEASPLVAVSPRGPAPADAVGLPLWGTQIRICCREDEFAPPGDVGEIVVRGHNVMNGYRPPLPAVNAFSSSGWLRTGDVGRLDAEGFLYVLDRRADVIHTSMGDVYPSHVEAVLRELPGIAEAAVVAAGPALSATVRAVVVRTAEATVVEADILAFCRQRLDQLACPREIVFADSLPKDATGRVIRRLLRD